jgi:valyl-tRNA synthetase
MSLSKSGDIIEAVLKPQWWVSCKPLAEEAIKVGFHRFVAAFSST